MTLPTSPASISLAQVNTELGFASNASINMNSAAVRTLFAKATGVIAMSDGYGKGAAPPTTTWNISSGGDWGINSAYLFINGSQVSANFTTASGTFNNNSVVTAAATPESSGIIVIGFWGSIAGYKGGQQSASADISVNASITWDTTWGALTITVESYESI